MPLTLYRARSMPSCYKYSLITSKSFGVSALGTDLAVLSSPLVRTMDCNLGCTRAISKTCLFNVFLMHVISSNSLFVSNYLHHLHHIVVVYDVEMHLKVFAIGLIYSLHRVIHDLLDDDGFLLLDDLY